MEFLDYETVIKKIIEKYDRNPEDWQVLMGRSPRGFFDILFSNQEEVWHLKLDTIYRPNPIGFGTKVEIEPSKIRLSNFPSYGFRPVTSKILEHITSQENRNQNDISSVLMQSISQISPVPTRELKNSITAVGPFIQRPVIEPVSKNQKELSRKLDIELEKIMKEKYPMYY